MSGINLFWQCTIYRYDIVPSTDIECKPHKKCPEILMNINNKPDLSTQAHSSSHSGPTTQTSQEDERTLSDNLIRELASLRASIEEIKSHRYFQVHNSRWKMVRFQLLRGMAFGLGSVLGATVILSLLGYILSHIDFLPIIGEYATEIEKMIQEAQTQY